MRFLPSSFIVSLVVLLSLGTTVPVAEPKPHPVGFVRDNDLIPRKDCPAVNQTNNCQTGTPFCCSPGEKGECQVQPASSAEQFNPFFFSGPSCQKATVTCDQIVICCNNAFGVGEPHLLFPLPLLKTTLDANVCWSNRLYRSSHDHQHVVYCVQSRDP